MAAGMIAEGKSEVCAHRMQKTLVRVSSITLREKFRAGYEGHFAKDWASLKRSIAEFFAVGSTAAALIFGPVAEAGLRVVTEAEAHIP